jgi:hypothetical protein
MALYTAGASTETTSSSEKTVSKESVTAKSETKEATDPKPATKDLQTATPPPGTGNQNKVNPVPERAEKDSP